MYANFIHIYIFQRASRASTEENLTDCTKSHMTNTESSKSKADFAPFIFSVLSDIKTVDHEDVWRKN